MPENIVFVGDGALADGTRFIALQRTRTEASRSEGEKIVAGRRAMRTRNAAGARRVVAYVIHVFQICQIRQLDRHHQDSTRTTPSVVLEIWSTSGTFSD